MLFRTNLHHIWCIFSKNDDGTAPSKGDIEQHQHQSIKKHHIQLAHLWRKKGTDLLYIHRYKNILHPITFLLSFQGRNEICVYYAPIKKILPKLLNVCFGEILIFRKFDFDNRSKKK